MWEYECLALWRYSSFSRKERKVKSHAKGAKKGLALLLFELVEDELIRKNLVIGRKKRGMKKWLPILLILVVGIIVVYSLQGGESKEAYVERIEEERQRIERFMEASPKSPFAPENIAFKGLSYYPPDPAYRVQARIEPVQGKKLIVLPTTTGEEEKYIRYGYATFTLNGQPQKLLVLESFEQPASLSVMFADETSGEETYGGGRYLNLEKPGRTDGKTLELDFNLAYNPYCAYNQTFSCPLPPKENVLQVPIRAGEKMADQ